LDGVNKDTGKEGQWNHTRTIDIEEDYREKKKRSKTCASSEVLE